MALINTFAERVILPAGDLISKQHVFKSLFFLNNSQFWSKDQILEYQNSTLKDILVYSSKHVPYYRDIFNDLRLTINDFRDIKDLSKLPILTKATIKENGIERFKSEALQKKDLLLSSSSGSTGEPLFYYNTKKAYSMNLATSLRGWYWMGYRLGDKYMKLSQNPRHDVLKRIQDKISRNLYLSTNPLNEENFKLILDSIEKYKPEIIRCYPDPLLFLARFRKNHGEYSYKPLALTTTGNTLDIETRNEIEESFGCKIFDSYSCEGNSTVFECPTHTGYHSAEEYGITEIIDDNGKIIDEGIGRLISTDLWNYAHPFIRYDTQDLVEVTSEPCSCGRKLKRIKRIIGRMNDIIENRSGRKFIVHNFTGFFQQDNPNLRRSIDQFQIIRKKDCLHFKLVVNSSFNESVKICIKEYWSKEFGEPVEIDCVDSIPFGASGKRKFIINEVSLQTNER